MKIALDTMPPRYRHYIKGSEEKGFWVFRYSAEYPEGSIPSSRVVYFGHTRDDASHWITTQSC